MRWILFWVVLVIFIALVVLTTVSLFTTFLPLDKEFKPVMVTTFVVEVGIAIFGLFYSLFGIKKSGGDGNVKIRLNVIKDSDISQYYGKKVEYSLFDTNSKVIHSAKANVFDENGPTVIVPSLEGTHNVFLTLQLNHEFYTGSFTLDSRLVDLEKEDND